MMSHQYQSENILHFLILHSDKTSIELKSSKSRLYLNHRDLKANKMNF